VGEALRRTLRWKAGDARDFAGRYLSEPKQNAFFTPPARALPRAAFERRAARAGLELDARARLLFSGTMLYMNGEAERMAARAAPGLRRLADQRRLGGPLAMPREFWDAAHRWYLQGFLHTGGKA
jgi:50S ribosomal protein L16 3-hydroxylase